ncbi:hypothetical protein NXS19_002129 [Fusarium pseudograminearum]|nr:hypothetical protein NXS19_002129 [Fusarium pseudograminearum]
MPDESLKLDPAAITYFGEPFTLTPVVSDILRTRYCVPGSIFLVEGIDRVSVSRSGRWQAIRLILGDGELCIQALLGSDMHRFVQMGDVALGAYVRCDMFHLQEVGKENMVTLIVDNLITIGWNESYRMLQKEDGLAVRERPKRIPRSRAESKPVENPPEPQNEFEEEIPEELLEQLSEELSAEPSKEPPRDSSKWPPKPFVEDEFDDDEAAAEEAFQAFQTLAFAPQPKTPQKATVQVQQTPPSAQPTEPVALPRDWHHPQTPSNSRLCAQSPTCLTSRTGPAIQRTARLVDPSTSKQVHLTVFLDPEKFNPRVGSAVLLVGVKNHRFDGGSLKKYESDRNNGRWWFENPVEMTWCDVEGIKAWWSKGVEAQP